jgi:8-oxo-dGTP pyrophosphatase MutT (NUDIX family)
MASELSLQEVTLFLTERLKGVLPGAHAHEQMQAIPTGNARLKFDHAVPPRQGSVLILLYEQAGFVHFPLIKRPEYSGAHSGQVSLPGGKTEPGEDIITTALRECEEEIGIQRSNVAIIGKLTDFHVVPSNFLVTPVIGVMRSTPVFIPDPFEVARVFPASLEDLVKAEAVKKKEIIVGAGFQLIAPHFEIDGEIVWGATAMILGELRSLLMEDKSQ